MILPGKLRSFVNRRLPLLFAALLATPGAPALAEEQRWFQVELIAFARNWDDSGEEQWPRNLQLEYPDNWVVLRTPDELAAQREAEALAQHIRRDPLSYPVPWEERQGEAAAVVPELEVDLAKDPFLRLTGEQRDLNRFATALDRRGEYRVLFHQAWRQPIVEEDQAPWILISAGEEYGPYRELEGSIQLSVSRFLHLNTRLWLTEFAANHGQRLDGWPEPPLNPTRTHAQGTDAHSTTPGRPGGDRDLWSNQLDPEQSRHNSFGFLDSPYRATRIATLEQSRRMRSEELHYIDHPLMGLVLRITPYELPPAEEADTAEQMRP